MRPPWTACPERRSRPGRRRRAAGRADRRAAGAAREAPVFLAATRPPSRSDPATSTICSGCSAAAARQRRRLQRLQGGDAQAAHRAAHGLHRISDIEDYVRLLRARSRGARAPAGRAAHPRHVVLSRARVVPDVAGEAVPAPVCRQARDSPFRFWVPGCSTGEEVYSLAMIADRVSERAERRGPAADLRDRRQRHHHREGAGRASTRPASPRMCRPRALRRFFTPFDGGYRINKDVRDRCVFARQDVTRDPPFSKLDVIICRNLLIYLNQATQRKVLGVFHYALRPDGVLMLGRSETIGSQADLFSVADKTLSALRKKRTGTSEAGLDFPPFSRSQAAAGDQEPRASIVRAPASGTRRATPTASCSSAMRPPAVIVDADNRVLRSRGQHGSLPGAPVR